ncbi:class I SAM-dependent methyltransferase [Streptomyces lunaelactis]|uniref:class I SAM-dependent methyltransferase n=1 Tax=Streptomyces lunaelactis TaxID=1535768 RepID=UPI001585684E|nr:class I SAM-dependent methyltransferase [Streptomyces lunaelactis]NUK11786.1 class I SAM-dependent methyltransferase [Streptomyces lunaelactis]NUL14198.1 class I SAM-dependent methyltransferase [Streptomyces lunaelactis]NUL27045.1 class I SAM-dependent methyltransferase [Streptomyces lunaelactis]
MSQTSTPAQSPAAATAGEDADELLPRPTRFADVKGWFWPADQLLFDWFLSYQRDTDPEGRGDLLELGAYLGKSAIFTGVYLRDGEEFTVCDLWDSPAPDDSNSAEMDRSYSTLTRRAFEANYLSFHDELPTMVQAPTSVITSRVRPHSCRFVHVDASHLYEHVHGDIEAAQELLQPEGIVSFDDFRAEHCPGVSAAVWGAVATTGLKPIVITGTKLYGTWGDPAPVREALLGWLEKREDLWHGVEEVAGLPLIRIKGTKAKVPAHPASRHEPEAQPEPDPEPRVVPASASAPAAPPRPRHRSRTRRLAKDLLPPIVTRAIVRRRTA